MSDMSELPGTPESKKPDHSSPKEKSAQAVSLEQLYYTPNPNVADLAGDVKSISNVEGTDDDNFYYVFM